MRHNLHAERIILDLLILRYADDHDDWWTWHTVDTWTRHGEELGCFTVPHARYTFSCHLCLVVCLVCLVVMASSYANGQLPFDDTLHPIKVNRTTNLPELFYIFTFSHRSLPPSPSHLVIIIRILNENLFATCNMCPISTTTTRQVVINTRHTVITCLAVLSRIRTGTFNRRSRAEEDANYAQRGRETL